MLITVYWAYTIIDNGNNNYSGEIKTTLFIRPPLCNSISWSFCRFRAFIVWLLKYKDKRLSIIGAAGILWTILVYSALFYAGTHASVFKKGFENISQMQLNSLVKNIEFYKLSHGQYPDRLEQLRDDDKLAPINDAAQGMNIKEIAYYNYEKIGEKYVLFSSGQDGIPHTTDDLFPQVTITDSSKIGWIKHR